MFFFILFTCWKKTIIGIKLANFVTVEIYAVYYVSTNWQQLKNNENLCSPGGWIPKTFCSGVNRKIMIRILFLLADDIGTR